jgi:hypothetical protein
MKLIRFTSDTAGSAAFGVVLRDHAVSFAALQRASRRTHPELADSRSYLAGLPGSEEAAQDLLAWGEEHLGELGEPERPPLGEVRLLEPFDVAALFDFGLTPRHLKNSAGVRAVAGLHLQAGHRARARGRVRQRAPARRGRLHLQDVSARDVQALEFIGGFCMTKDMAKGNQLGPYLVTLDEVGDPYNLAVTVTVNGEPRFQGSTTEIDHKAEDVFAFLETMAPLKSGSVIGCGTIPDCTGLDHDDFLDPGDEVEISFERLGTLRCRFAEPVGELLPSRWPVRSSVLGYHGGE